MDLIKPAILAGYSIWNTGLEYVICIEGPLWTSTWLDGGISTEINVFLIWYDWAVGFELKHYAALRSCSIYLGFLNMEYGRFYY